MTVIDPTKSNAIPIVEGDVQKQMVNIVNGRIVRKIKDSPEAIVLSIIIFVTVTKFVQESSWWQSKLDKVTADQPADMTDIDAGMQNMLGDTLKVLSLDTLLIVAVPIVLWAAAFFGSRMWARGIVWTMHGKPVPESYRDELQRLNKLD